MAMRSRELALGAVWNKKYGELWVRQESEAISIVI